MRLSPRPLGCLQNMKVYDKLVDRLLDLLKVKNPVVSKAKV